MSTRPENLYCSMCLIHTTHSVTRKRTSPRTVFVKARCTECGMLNKQHRESAPYDPRFDDEIDAFEGGGRNPN